MRSHHGGDGDDELGECGDIMVAMMMMSRENAETVQMASRISIHSQLIPNLGHDEDDDDDVMRIMMVMMMMITLVLRSKISF